MAETPPSREELDLRRRARRRLVGAVALALLAVVVLPMVFDPEPRPLGDNVEIRIPDQTAPFQPSPAAPTGATGQGATATAEPAEPPEITAPTPAEPAPVEPPAKAVPAGKPDDKAKAPIEPASTAAKPATKPAAKSIDKPIPKAAEKVTAKPADRPSPAKQTAPSKAAEPKSAASGDAYYLQLGVFASRANAEQMVARAKAAGFKAAVTQNGSQFKVRVGPIPDRAKAVDYQGKLKARGLDNVLVDS